MLKKLFQKKSTKPIETYKDFWDWFLIHEKKFFTVVKKGNCKAISTKFFDRIAPKLDELKEGVFFLTGMLNKNTADFILTSDGTIENFYFIEELVAQAPNLPNWHIQAHKPSSKNTEIDMKGYKFRKENIFFYSNDFDEYPDEIDITIVHEDYNTTNKETIINGCYVFLDNFLGELKLVTAIDNIRFVKKSEAEKELVPIEKLDAFLTWREKEFIEKYESRRHNTEEDNYVSLQTTLKNGNPLFIMMNSDLLAWEETASHPWILKIKIAYNGRRENALPDEETYNLLNDFEGEINKTLKDFDGYLNVGRETGDNLREIYIACKDFRKPSKVVNVLKQKYRLDISYTLTKDKYWQCFEWHRKGVQISF